MRKFIREKKVVFLKSKFLVFLLGIIIGSTFMFLYIVGTDYYNWAKEGLEIVEMYSVEASDIRQDMGMVVPATVHLDNLSNRGEILSPEALIRKIAKEENFAEVENLLRLSMCESSLGKKNTHKNNDTHQSTDRGIWMINDYWHPEVTDEQAYDNEWATRWTIQRIKAGYLHEWNCSGVWDDINYKLK